MPTAKVRAATYTRDGYRCADCGTTEGLSFQHRSATGMGGSRIPVTTADGLTLCLVCNQSAEAEGQMRALHLGHKVRRFRGRITTAQVPFYVAWAREWWLPDTAGGKQILHLWEARDLLEVAGAYTTTLQNQSPMQEVGRLPTKLDLSADIHGAR